MRRHMAAPWLIVGQGLLLATALSMGPRPLWAQPQSAEPSAAEPSAAGSRQPTTTPDPTVSAPRMQPSERLLRSFTSPTMVQLADEVLERNHRIARARQLAVAAAVRAPQVRALPDPHVSLDLFVLPPESRVGPQRLQASIHQELPWFGKLDLAEQAALFEATAKAADVETLRLDMLFETRRLAYELAFHHLHHDIVAAERQALVRYEKVAQAHYAAGTGLQQEIVRIQAQITRLDTQLLEIDEHRSHVLSSLNGLRDRPADTPPEFFELPAAAQPHIDGDALRRLAQARRPELLAADAVIAAQQTRVELAQKDSRPDLTLGLSYTAVTGREDPAGRAAPPPDDGDDILALSASMNLPVWKGKLEAAVDEAQALRRAAESTQRDLLTRIEAEIGDLTVRIPLLYRHHHLLETVLFKQAREALRSAESAYRTGKLNAFDLLDSEVVLFEVQLAALRTRTDLAIAWAQLERAAASPIDASRAAASPMIDTNAESNAETPDEP